MEVRRTKKEYLDTIELQMKWSAFSRSGKGEAMWGMLPTGDQEKPFKSATRDREGRTLHHTAASRTMERAYYEEALRSPNVFYVGPEFCRLIDTARQTLPDDVHFDPSWVPTDTGFMVMANRVRLPMMNVHPSIDLTDGKNERRFAIDLGAFGWIRKEGAVTFTGFQTGSIDMGDGTYVDNDKDVPFFPVTYFTLIDGQNIRERVTVFESNTNKQDDYLMYSDEDLWRHEIRWVYTALLMMDQRLLVSRRHPVDRAARRRMEHAGREVVSNINVITLRRLADAQEPGDDATEAERFDYSCHFEVKGHWRQQFYPSTQTHKPKWIFPYLKGDLDKPFREKKRLFAAVR